MATPVYDALVAKVRDWANKPSSSTIPDSVIASCLNYSADEVYRTLRIPPLETTARYTVTSDNNVGEASLGQPYGNAWTKIKVPRDLIQFNMIRTVAESNQTTPYSTYPSNISKVFNEVTDKRTFFDAYSEKYSVYHWTWVDDDIYIRPQLAVDAVIEINYYRRLPALDKTYDVISSNFLTTVPEGQQPYLVVDPSSTHTLYFVQSETTLFVYDTEEESDAKMTELAGDGMAYSVQYSGREIVHWLKDQNERLLMWGALSNIGAYLFDDKMEQKYKLKFSETIDALNREERFRRASGGNVQMNFNTNGLI